MQREKRSLLNNTIMLYIMTFSNYLLSFIIVPYQTRVLGPEFYGLIGLATAIMVYFQLFIDFGFLLSATEEVAFNREDNGKLCKIFTSITLNKLLLSLISAVVLFTVCAFIPRWRDNFLLLFLYFLSTVATSLLPDYLYRGMEKMTGITVRTVCIRALFVCLVFIFVKEPSDYILVPVLFLIGNLLALFVSYIHLYYKYKIHFTLCNAKDVFSRMKASAMFFISRIASTMYTVANTIVLDFISLGAMTAYYSSADKLVSTAKSGLTPVSDSLYPYMVKNKDFKLVKKILLLLEPVIFLGCLILFIWAEPICTWFFGAEYAFTATPLRTLLPIVVIILPSYIFGFPVLSAMGLSKYANYSVIFGSCLHVITLGVLFAFNMVNMFTLGIATSIAEFSILLFRIIVVVKNRKLLKENNG